MFSQQNSLSLFGAWTALNSASLSGKLFLSDDKSKVILIEYCSLVPIFPHFQNSPEVCISKTCIEALNIANMHIYIFLMKIIVNSGNNNIRIM